MQVCTGSKGVVGVSSYKYGCSGLYGLGFSCLGRCAVRVMGCKGAVVQYSWKYGVVVMTSYFVGYMLSRCYV